VMRQPGLNPYNLYCQGRCCVRPGLCDSFFSYFDGGIPTETRLTFAPLELPERTPVSMRNPR
jgi:hypothetical protein